ncbi:diaminopropionate ammonia-lyase family protein [Podospora didyma]|uniref:Diaminopropionate ammonia-lyase family protein n=1 Tax=Podospora didyma TaxID=330526 RepID=A0AAE0P4Y0_9PEZI|nr:diaminopropionate ammonia-lyase family protein [Podospora didyma]
MASGSRNPIILNPLAKEPWRFLSSADDRARAFHQSMPGYSLTPLVSMPQIAAEVGVGAVHVKYEGDRMGLPSFKILGASWATFCAVASYLKLPLNSSLTVNNLRDVLTGWASSHSQKPTLVAATDGNHGRAVAYMGRILGLPVKVFVPGGLDNDAVQAIVNEGAAVARVRGSYDLTVNLAFNVAKNMLGGILVQDTSFPGYTDVPEWVVEGYDTMLSEIDEQLENQSQPADLIIVPVGVGSLAQAVVTHYRSLGVGTKVLTVEPDTAACLYTNLRGDVAGQKPVPLETTGPTIMAGLDCGTVSLCAWNLLNAAVDACLSVSDHEAHSACGILKTHGVAAGPCGAASLAALLRLGDKEKKDLGLGNTSVVVLLCTEGERQYSVPAAGLATY